MPWSALLIAAAMVVPSPAPSNAEPSGPSSELGIAETSAAPEDHEASASPEPSEPTSDATHASAVGSEDAPSFASLTLADESFDDGDGGEEPFELQPAAPEPRRRNARKSVWGQALLTAGPIVGLGTPGGFTLQQVGFGASATRFVLPFLGLGFSLEDFAVFAGDTLNLFQITPKATLLVLPHLRLSPVVTAGFGGAFFNHGGGAHGRWVAGVGAMLALFEHATVGVGVDFEGYAPKEHFYRYFRCEPYGKACHIGRGPWLAVGVRF